MHLLRVLIQVRQRVLKAHQEVALLEDTGTHKACQQLLLPAGRPCRGAARLPALRAGGDIRRVHRLPPAGNVRTHRQAVCGDGHRPRRVGGKADGGAPAVFADGPPLPVAPQIGVDGIVQAHVQRLVLAQLAIRLAIGLQQLQKVLLGCHHIISPLRYRVGTMYTSWFAVRSYMTARTAGTRPPPTVRRPP